MGTDIHTFIEQYDKPNKCWFLLKYSFDKMIEANQHDLFDNLAETQKETTASKAKGLPYNVSSGTKQHHEDTAFFIHHESFYSLYEFLDIYKHSIYEKEHIARLNLRYPNLSKIEQSVLNDYNQFDFAKARFAFTANETNDGFIANQHKYRVVFWFDS